MRQQMPDTPPNATQWHKPIEHSSATMTDYYITEWETKHKSKKPAKLELEK